MAASLRAGWTCAVALSLVTVGALTASAARAEPLPQPPGVALLPATAPTGHAAWQTAVGPGGRVAVVFLDDPDDTGDYRLSARILGGTGWSGVVPVSGPGDVVSESFDAEYAPDGGLWVAWTVLGGPGPYPAHVARVTPGGATDDRVLAEPGAGGAGGIQVAPTAGGVGIAWYGFNSPGSDFRTVNFAFHRGGAAGWEEQSVSSGSEAVLQDLRAAGPRLWMLYTQDGDGHWATYDTAGDLDGSEPVHDGELERGDQVAMATGAGGDVVFYGIDSSGVWAQTWMGSETPVNVPPGWHPEPGAHASLPGAGVRIGSARHDGAGFAVVGTTDDGDAALHVGSGAVWNERPAPASQGASGFLAATDEMLVTPASGPLQVWDRDEGSWSLGTTIGTSPLTARALGGGSGTGFLVYDDPGVPGTQLRWLVSGAAPDPPPFVQTTRPVLRGKPMVGERLTVRGGQWSLPVTRKTYRWYAGSAAIPRATRASLLLRPKLRGTRISVRVTVRSADGRALTVVLRAKRRVR